VLLRGRDSYLYDNVLSPTHDTAVRKHRSERRVAIIADMVRSEVIPGGRVVELGCGTGATAVDVSNRVPDVHVLGVDVSESMVAYAHEHHRGLRRRFAVVDVTDRWARPPVDLVYSIDLIHRVTDRTLLLNSVRRMLDIGGSWLAFEPNGLNPVVKMRHAHRSRRGHDAGSFLPWRARTVLAASGFYVEGRRPLLTFPQTVRPGRWAVAIERHIEPFVSLADSIAWELKAM
jgi:trans-aconitate methyltransferase